MRILQNGKEVGTVKVDKGTLSFETDNPELKSILQEVENGLMLIGGGLEGDSYITTETPTNPGDSDFLDALFDRLAEDGFELDL